MLVGFLFREIAYAYIKNDVALIYDTPGWG